MSDLLKSGEKHDYTEERVNTYLFFTTNLSYEIKSKVYCRKLKLKFKGMAREVYDFLKQKLPSEIKEGTHFIFSFKSKKGSRVMNITFEKTTKEQILNEYIEWCLTC